MRRGVALNRALSKLNILSRSEATAAIRSGRVRVDGVVVHDPLAPVVPGRIKIEIDGAPQSRAAWRTLLFYKPRGVMTTRRDSQGRRTIYDVIGPPGRGLIAVGRLDLATAGLLVLTTDTELANWIADPANAVSRLYVVTVRGKVTDETVARLTVGVGAGGEILRAESVLLRKASSRESHLVIELREGKNREVRRLLEATGHEVTRLKRVRLGGLELGSLGPGQWRTVSRREITAGFPGAPVTS